MKPGDLVRIKDTPVLAYQGYSNKIGLIVKKITERRSFEDMPVIMYVVLIEEKLIAVMGNELDKVENDLVGKTY